MSIEEIASISAPFTGYCHVPIRKSYDAGKETPEAREAIIQKVFEDDRKMVPPIYNIQGKRIEYDKCGRHLDIKV